MAERWTMAMLLGLGVGLLLTTGRGEAQSAAADEKGFVSIFNGVDLLGWTYGDINEGRARRGKGYQVKNRVLYCTTEDGGNLFTKREYSDFVLRLEFKLSENANNGIGIRAPFTGDSSFTGMEIQVLDDSGSKHRNLKADQYTGSIYDIAPAKRGALRPVGQWNEQEITANGKQITVKLNGQVVLDVNLDKLNAPDKLRKRPGVMNRRGHIGLMWHASYAEFRNIRIKELGR